ncbi:MAG: ketol-acid reductoisomerase [Candidatus Omnitrophica bacterium]|nr:ketol-acid reductoisomerase [Candidatus Omnitrophota bacterium]MDE2009107.1 ketol-acid reductoisomerase [Candidatus Omnitrophota bacterium]MDE2214228.1 ketol-acid reductoisomerase [Candidatus Omnitrophota bacterium]MDE2231265.1 ketol-acid reductoisomerase [Candidatus Omnitrophota bacterium]
MAKIFYDKDCKINDIKDKTIAVVGYGIQGRGQALNLRDSGLKVIVAQRPGGPNYEKAIEDGFKPVSVDEATRKAEVIILLTQDHLQADIYRNSIEPYLTRGKALAFSHGFNIHFKFIVPPKDVDVFMIAPKGPGALVRRQYEEGRGVPCLVAVHQNATGKALKIALAYAKGIGGSRAGIIQTTFKEETETDLFGEQSVLCGGASELIKAGWETLVAAGYQPEIAYFECLHELKLIVDLIYEDGIQGMRRRVSDTAEYGDMTRGKRIVDARTRKEMQKILKEIQTGKFAGEWMAENKKGRKNFLKMRKIGEKHPVEKVGARLRAMMSWMKK